MCISDNKVVMLVILWYDMILLIIKGIKKTRFSNGGE